MDPWNEPAVPPECLDTGPYPVKNVSHFYTSEYDHHLFQNTLQSNIVIFIVPILSGIGVTASLLVALLLQHPDLRGFSSMILQANLFTDVVYLITATFVIIPKFQLSELYLAGKYDEFWKNLAGIQDTYIIGYPIYRETGSLSVWYTAALIMEQYLAYANPEKLARWAEKGLKIKMIITLLNANILVHIMLFFKFVKEGICVAQYPVEEEDAKNLYGIYKANLVCLSTTYRKPGYIIYEKYIYYFLFDLLPWVLSLCALGMSYAYYKLQKQQLAANAHIFTGTLLRTFQSGRSVENTFGIMIAFLSITFIRHIAYMICHPNMVIGELDQHCNLNPFDIYNLQVHQVFTTIFFYAPYLNALVKPWICLFLHQGLKIMLMAFYRRTQKCLKITGRNLCLVLDCSRPTPPSDDIGMAASNNDLLRSEGEATAAPYSNGELHAYENIATD
ncbi:hypothetical protein CAPTEDRAFT_198499 [Capitella teleta]|uniref:G-protein coupled receptors family 1 profile domain-containing protein n=1 Tax=Capitella teleta TaxID=283909 RepID=R7UE75_CAPTE|nr:hypothetical protein CAPTEDRAFT_198499 [Capitella teleta]|eukprot:ELU04839.1 hypothetical protein CAPTEDRAFT_198499 [Capitella teleta]